MQAYRNCDIPIGALITPSAGLYKDQLGIVVDQDYRREHSYLDRDLWVLLLLGENFHWQRAYECYVLSEVG